MVTYRAYGTSIGSALPLAARPDRGQPGFGERFDVEWIVGERAAGDVKWHYSYRSGDGRTWMELGRVAGEGGSAEPTGRQLVFRFPGIADFWCNAQPPLPVRITCYCSDSSTPETLQHLLLNQVCPDLISAGDSIVLHAGAVEVANVAVALLGPSGIGKSSLVAAFIAAGYRALTDDVLRIERVGDRHMAIASYPALRLSPEQGAAIFGPDTELKSFSDYSHKRAAVIAPDDFCADPIPLGCCYFLDPEPADAGAAIEFLRLSERDACVDAIPQGFRLDPHDGRLLRQEFMRFQQLTQEIPFYKLRYPLGTATLPAITRAVSAHVEQNILSRDPPLRE